MVSKYKIIINVIPYTIEGAVTVGLDLADSIAMGLGVYTKDMMSIFDGQADIVLWLWLV